MTHHLTHDLCRRLRNAGLPQPENMELGQNWYVKDNSMAVIANFDIGTQDVYFWEKAGGYIISYYIEFLETSIFHPSLEYLLQHLPNEMTLRRDSHGKWYFGTEKMDGLKITGFEAIAEADTPLQAAALAYLHLHEKTSAP